MHRKPQFHINFSSTPNSWLVFQTPACCQKVFLRMTNIWTVYDRNNLKCNEQTVQWCYHGSAGLSGRNHSLLIRSNKVRRQDSLRMCARFGTRQKKLDLVHHQIKSIYRVSHKNALSEKKIKAVVDNNYWKLWSSFIPTKLVNCCSRCVSLQDSNDDSERFFWDTLYIIRKYI